MGQLQPFTNFIGPTYTSQSLTADAERCVNLYPERIEAPSEGGKAAPLVYYGTPGLGLFCALPDAPIRAMYEINGRVFVVTGANLYELTQSGGYFVRGAIQPSSFASITSNGAQLAIAVGAAGYVYDLTANTLTQIQPSGNAAGWLGASTLTALDGYIVALAPNSQTIYHSAIRDATTWSALAYTTAQGGPDNVVTIIANQRELFVFARYRTQIYYDAGTIPFAFALNQNAYIEVGCAAAQSVAQFANTLAWLGSDARGGPVVYLLAGYTPQRISTHALESAMQGYSVISDAIAFVEESGGHTNYWLHFPTANVTWVYDLATGLWHERLYWDATAGQYRAHLARTHCYGFGKHLVGDYLSGNVYVLSPQYLSDNGAPIRRMRTAPHLSNLGSRVFFSEFRLDVQAGVGADGDPTQPAANPQIALQLSNDGGFTWGNERAIALGQIGQRRQRVAWRRLGHARDRVFRIVISDPVFVCIVAAYLDVTYGRY